MDETVAIIVPVYNVEPYLRQCLDSIVAQTYCNIKVYLVNDGSTDGSGTILDDYVNSWPDMFFLITQENQGLSAARNAALGAINADYVTFIDPDDYVHPTYVERLLETARQTGSQLVQADHIHFKENGCAIERHCALQGVFDVSKNASVVCDLSVLVWGKIYHRSLFEDIQMRYPIGFTHEDTALTPRLAARCGKIACIADCLYYYRFRPESLSNVTGNFQLQGWHWKGIAELYLSDTYRQICPDLFEFMAILSIRKAIFSFIYAGTSLMQIHEIISFLDSKIPQWRDNIIMREKWASRRMRLWMGLMARKRVRALIVLCFANKQGRTLERKLWRASKREIVELL